jgi:hypothetical protein
MGAGCGTGIRKLCAEEVSDFGAGIITFLNLKAVPHYCEHNVRECYRCFKCVEIVFNNNNNNKYNNNV